MVVLGKKLLYSRKSGCIRTKGGCILAKDFVIGQSCCIREKVVVIGQNLYSGKMVVFRQKLLQSG